MVDLKLEYRKEESYGVIVLDPESEAEYYALKHWLGHAENCGLPSHMIELRTPAWIKSEEEGGQNE